MAREKFTEETWNAESELLIGWMEKVTESYASRGYSLSLRQLYYVGVASNMYANKQSNYNKLGDLLTKARLAGRIDWHIIVDRNRTTNDHNYFDDLKDCLQHAAKGFRIDKWLKQPSYVEVAIEKASLEGVIQRPCSSHQVPYTATRGYPSATLMYDMAHRFRERTLMGGKSCHLIYLGDHDPSGVDIDRDIKDRLTMMSGVPVYVHRIALNRNQVDQYGCPPNPAKLSDSRATSYVEKHGNSSWEVDALDPSLLGELVDSAIWMFKDAVLWDNEVQRERALKNKFQDIIDQEEQGGDSDY